MSKRKEKIALADLGKELGSFSLTDANGAKLEVAYYGETEDIQAVVISAAKPVILGAMNVHALVALLDLEKLNADGKARRAREARDKYGDEWCEEIGDHRSACGPCMESFDAGEVPL